MYSLHTSESGHSGRLPVAISSRQSRVRTQHREIIMGACCGRPCCCWNRDEILPPYREIVIGRPITADPLPPPPVPPRAPMLPPRTCAGCEANWMRSKKSSWEDLPTPPPLPGTYRDIQKSWEHLPLAPLPPLASASCQENLQYAEIEEF